MRDPARLADSTFLDAKTYNQLFTMHGTTMIFLVVVPIAAGFANYLVPLMIGARDMAFPRLNMLSWWLLVLGGMVLYTSLLLAPPAAGWTSYAPLSSDGTSCPTNGIDAWIVSLHLVGISSILGAINFIVTIHNMRAPGHVAEPHAAVRLDDPDLLVPDHPRDLVARRRRSRCCWSTATSTAPSSTRHQGGAPLLWQHLFWFFGHPEVYIMVLPAFGIVSEVIPVFARKPIFGYKAIATATAAIAFVSVLVWAHHMFSTPAADGGADLLHAHVARGRGPDRASRSSTGSRRCGAATSSSACRCCSPSPSSPSSSSAASRA